MNTTDCATHGKTIGDAISAVSGDAFPVILAIACLWLWLRYLERRSK
jgi:hypothetical protein